MKMTRVIRSCLLIESSTNWKDDYCKLSRNCNFELQIDVCTFEVRD